MHDRARKTSHRRRLAKKWCTHTPLVCTASVLLFLTCASEEQSREVIDIVFDPCSPLQLYIEGATSMQRDAIQAGLEQWRRGAGALVTVVADPEADTPMVPVILDRAPHAFHGHYADEDGVVYLNEDLDGVELAITMAHELGHVFGLYHVPREEGASVMNPGNLVHEVQPVDVEALGALWGSCEASPLS